MYFQPKTNPHLAPILGIGKATIAAIPLLLPGQQNTAAIARPDTGLSHDQCFPKTIDKEQETFCCIFPVSQGSALSYHPRVSIPVVQVPMLLHFTLKSIPVT